MESVGSQMPRATLPRESNWHVLNEFELVATPEAGGLEATMGELLAVATETEAALKDHEKEKPFSWMERLPEARNRFVSNRFASRYVFPNVDGLGVRLFCLIFWGIWVSSLEEVGFPVKGG